MAMASDLPSFHEPGSEEDDARWQAYCEMLRRTGAAQEAEPEFEKPLEFVEEFEVVSDSAGADLDQASRGDPNLWPNGLSARTFEPIDVAPSGRRVRQPRRNSRLIVGALALTSGLVLAAAVVPRQSAEPVVIYRDRPQSPVGAPVQAAAPAKPAPPLAKVQALAKSAAPAPLAAPPPVKAETAVLDARDEGSDTAAVTDRPKRRQVRLDAPAQPRKEALACWLTVMNNGHDTAYADGRVSVCDGAAPYPEQFLGQAPAAPAR